MIKSFKRLVNSSVNAIESTGEAVGKYLAITDIHATAWVKEAARESAMSEKESVAEMAKRMQSLADELAKLDSTVIAETNAMIKEAYEQAGI